MFVYFLCVANRYSRSLCKEKLCMLARLHMACACSTRLGAMRRLRLEPVANLLVTSTRPNRAAMRPE